MKIIKLVFMVAQDFGLIKWATGYYGITKVFRTTFWIWFGSATLLNATAQTWPHFYLTNGIHETSYGVEIYDPSSAKNLYINPNAILHPGGTELADIYDENHLFLNGGGLYTSVLDGDDFTWNSGDLHLIAGQHTKVYGLESGSGKNLYIQSGEVRLNSLNALPDNNYIFMGGYHTDRPDPYSGSGKLSVADFDASNLNMLGGELEVTGELTNFDNSILFYSLGSIILNGQDAEWNASGAIKPVKYGEVRIEVKNGATLTSSGLRYAQSFNGPFTNPDNGGIEVQGAGSKWISNGSVSLGGQDNYLTITDGGSVLASSVSLSGDYNGGNNHIKVEGSNSKLEVSGGLYIDSNSIDNIASYMSILNGGVVSSGSSTIGGGGAGNGVEVTGSGSRWDIQGDLTLGVDNAGNYVSIDDGGGVSCENITIGVESFHYETSGNKITVYGAQSELNSSGHIVVGTSGNRANELTVENGGRIIASGGLTVIEGYDVRYPNKINVNSGGRLEIGTDFNASMTGFNYNSGSELSVEGQLSGLSDLESGRRLETPDLLGDFTVHGIFAPGTSPADSIVDGALTIASDGTLEMELSGYALGAEYDRLSITGFSTLDGLLDIVSLGGFAATNGASFDLFNWDGGVSGTFSAISTDALSTGQSWDTSELYTTGQLSVIPEPGSIGLLGLGSGILLFYRRRRRLHRGAGGTPAVHTAKPVSCDSFAPPAEVIAMHRRDFWDYLDSCAGIADRAKSISLRAFDVFLALVMK